MFPSAQEACCWGNSSAADICVDSSPANPYTDRSTMVKIMEYMSLGKPIVAFDLPEHRFTARGAAAYVTPNDERAFACTLAQLMDDPNRRMALGAYGRCRIQTQLAWEYSIPNLLSVYREVLPAAEIAETVIAHESKPAIEAREVPDADMHPQASQPETLHSHAKQTTAHLA